MKLIVGLGNPGHKYNRTRHNIGFNIVNKYRKEKADIFPDFILKKDFQAEMSEASIDGEKVILAKPQIFMNESGRAVSIIMKYYKLQLEDIIVVHDDSDLFIGKVRIRRGSQSAGHKGIDSMKRYLRSDNYIRIGVGIRDEKKDSEKKALAFVLKKFPRDSKKSLQKVENQVLNALHFLIKQKEDNFEEARNLYNGNVV
jgi:PTH1 family peptidyl-tRNA hydrolase